MSLLAYCLTAGPAVWMGFRRGVLSRAAALALLLLPLCLTGRAMVTGAIYGPVDLAYATEPLASIADRAGVTHVANPGVSDVYAQFIPWNDALRRAIRDGEWPLWSRYGALGNPLAAALQAAPYHPITLAGLLIPVEDAVTFTAAIVFFLAALTMFLFLRDLVESEIAALFGAAAVMFSTHLVWYAGTALAMAAAAFPLALLGARRVVHVPGRRSAAILGLALLLIVLAGHPESALHLVTLAVAYFVFEFIRVRPIRWGTAIASGIGAGVVSLLLSAIFLLPFFVAVVQTQEHLHRELTLERQHYVAGGAELAHRLAANAMPFIEGLPGVEEAEHARNVQHGWLATAYAGSVLFPPAILALLRVRSRQKWFFAVAGLIGLGAGTYAPGVTHLLGHLPGFKFAVNDRMIFYAVIALAVLGAIGLDDWLRRGVRLLPALFLGVAVIMMLGAFLIDSGLSDTYLRVHAARAILPLILGCAAMLVLRTPRAAIAILALLFVQRIGEAGELQATVPRSAFYPPFPGLELMKSPEPFRIVGVGVTLPPLTSTHYGLEDARGFEALTLGRYYAISRVWSVEQPVWFNRVDSLESPFFDLMNVRYAVAPSSYTPPAWWRTRGNFGEYAILENTRVLPRAFVPKNVLHRTRGHQSELDLRLVSDFSEVALLETGFTRGLSAPNGPGVVRTEDDGSGLRMTAKMSAPGWVVISNTAWKGWHVTIDGQEAPIVFANGAFLAVNVPAGEHRLRLFYQPRDFIIGAWISALTALATILFYRGIFNSAITFFMSLQTSFFADGLRSR